MRWAILGVMAYHLGLGWASGGYLGVDLFFVLSGFLITSLLLEEWCESARIRLGAFWGRRARRLLPALLLVLMAVSVYAVVNGRFSTPTTGGAAIDLSGLRGDGLATLFYFANWHAIFVHQSYFTQFSTPSPLQHTWSLAIEEQFYLVWPLVIVGLLQVGPPKRWRWPGSVSASSAPWRRPPPWRSCTTREATRPGSTTAPTRGPSTSWSGAALAIRGRRSRPAGQRAAFDCCTLPLFPPPSS